MYAIVNISGKQFKATEGARVRIPKQTGDAGATLTFDNVLLFHDGTNTQIGTPTISVLLWLQLFWSMAGNEKFLFIRKKDGKGIRGKMGTVSGTQK